MTSRSERSYHGRPRATTNVVNNAHAVVGRRNRNHGSATSSPSTRAPPPMPSGYDSDGTDLYETYGIKPRGSASRESSSDSLRSGSDLGESGELMRERRVSRGSSLDSFEMAIEKEGGVLVVNGKEEDGEAREKRVHSRSSSYDSALAGGERSEEDGEGGVVVQDDAVVEGRTSLSESMKSEDDVPELPASLPPPPLVPPLGEQ